MQFLTFSPKLFLHLPYHEYCICSALTLHEAKLHIINVDMLSNLVLKDLFHHFHSMFHQFIIIRIIIITDLYSAFRSKDTEALDAAQED